MAGRIMAHAFNDEFEKIAALIKRNPMSQKQLLKLKDMIKALKKSKKQGVVPRTFGSPPSGVRTPGSLGDLPRPKQKTKVRY
jgi:hypothetical protein